MPPARLFVYMIESPGQADLAVGRTEGAVLREALGIADVRADYRLATDLQTFGLAFDELIQVAAQAEANGTGPYPVLHISAHGHPEGIGLTDETFLEWDELKVRLQPVNQALNGHLLFALSSCHGEAGYRMAMHESEALPFAIMYSHRGAGDWSDLAIGFAAFYHRLITKNSGFWKPLEAAKAASGSDNFTAWARPAGQGYVGRVLPSTRIGYEPRSGL
jgi:hypothetical protein